MHSLLIPLRENLHYADLVREALADVEDERLRRERFRDEIREDQKAEFINGEVVMHSPAKLWHSEASLSICEIMRNFARVHKLGRVLHEKTMIALTRNDYEPDVVFFRNAKADKFEGRQMLFPTPDLAVEVLSDSTARRDRTVKLFDYAEHGVEEYWIVDPEKKTVEQYLLEDGAYRPAFTGSEGVIACRAMAGLRVPVAAIFSSDALGELLLDIALKRG